MNIGGICTKCYYSVFAFSFETKNPITASMVISPNTKNSASFLRFKSKSSSFRQLV